MILVKAVATVAWIILGLLLILLFLWLTLALTSAAMVLAEDVESHGPGWWAARIILGLVALGVGWWLWTLVAGAVSVVVNGPAYLLGVGLAKLLRIRGTHPTLFVIGVSCAEFGKQITGCLLRIALFWLLVLTPLWVAVPRWTLVLGILTWLVIWVPSLAITAFARTGGDARAADETTG